MLEQRLGRMSTCWGTVSARVARDNSPLALHLRQGRLLREGASPASLWRSKSIIGKRSRSSPVLYRGYHGGERELLGAGTVTCNFDGKKKNPTTIGELLCGATPSGGHVSLGDGCYLRPDHSSRGRPRRKPGHQESQAEEYRGWALKERPTGGE